MSTLNVSPYNVQYTALVGNILEINDDREYSKAIVYSVLCKLCKEHSEEEVAYR